MPHHYSDFFGRVLCFEKSTQHRYCSGLLGCVLRFGKSMKHGCSDCSVDDNYYYFGFAKMLVVSD